MLKEGLSAYAAIPETILKLAQKAGREGIAYIALKTGNKGAYLGYKLANTEIKLADVTAQQVFENIEWATKNGVVLEKIENVKYIDQAGKEQSGVLELVKQEDGKLGIKIPKHPNWVEITGIRQKVEDLTPHVLKVETNANGTFIPKSKTIGTTTFNMEGFKGCHTENALKEYVQTNGGTYTIKNKSVGMGGVYEGQPVIYLNNKEYVKINGQFVEYEAGKLGGTSSFFPENWSNAKIKEEVEYAIANNYGMAQDGSNTLYGFSKDGTVEIRFYYNADGSIGSYFPKKNK